MGCWAWQRGRFKTEDPIGFAGEDWNLYRYVRNKAASAIDPSGTKPLGDSLCRDLYGSTYHHCSGSQWQACATKCGGISNVNYCCSNNYSTPNAGVLSEAKVRIGSPQFDVGQRCIRVSHRVVSVPPLVSGIDEIWMSSKGNRIAWTFRYTPSHQVPAIVDILSRAIRIPGPVTTAIYTSTI